MSSFQKPDHDELAAARLVSVPERPLDVELPAPQGAVVADYAEALSASPLWQALEKASIAMNIDADLARPPAWLAQA